MLILILISISISISTSPACAAYRESELRQSSHHTSILHLVWSGPVSGSAIIIIIIIIIIGGAPLHITENPGVGAASFSRIYPS